MKKVLFVGYATIDIIKNKIFPGGAAGSMSINAAFLGVETHLLTVLANNTYGKFYIDKLKKAGVNISLCIFAPKLPTCIINDVCINGSKRIWNDNGINKYLTKININQKKLESFDAIFLANSHPVLAKKVVDKINLKNIFYIPGPQLVLQKNYIKNTILKKTRIVFGNQEESPFIFAQNPFLKGVEIIVITEGEKGGQVFLKNGDKIIFPPPQVKKVINTIGAGDNFTLGFGLAIANNKPIKEAIEQGKLLAKKTILQKGCIFNTYL